jgi:hypothetical protein
LFLRRRYLYWGATDDEMAMALPGDELLRQADLRWSSLLVEDHEPEMLRGIRDCAARTSPRLAGRGPLGRTPPPNDSTWATLIISTGGQPPLGALLSRVRFTRAGTTYRYSTIDITSRDSSSAPVPGKSAQVHRDAPLTA